MAVQRTFVPVDGRDPDHLAELLASIPPEHIQLVQSPDDVSGIVVRDPDKVAWLSQTTLSVDETLATVAAIRERLVVADVPAPFRGNAIALITAGLMSLAFMGFSGLVKL